MGCTDIHESKIHKMFKTRNYLKGFKLHLYVGWLCVVGHSTEVDNFRDWLTLPIMWFLERHYPLSQLPGPEVFFFLSNSA